MCYLRLVMEQNYTLHRDYSNRIECAMKPGMKKPMNLVNQRRVTSPIRPGEPC